VVEVYLKFISLIIYSRPETPGRESSVWNPSTVLEASTTSRWGEDTDTGGEGSGWNDVPHHDAVSDMQPTYQEQQQWQSASYGDSNSGSGSSVDDWGVDMIVFVRHGPETGKYAIIVHPPSRGEVGVRIRESSSSSRNSDDNPIIYMHVSDLRLGEPRRKDTAIVLNGAHKGLVGKVKALMGTDVLLHEMPNDIFALSQVAWLHTR
jgi:hypothetical protein